MFDFHEKRKIRGLIYSPAVIILIVMVSLWLSMSVYQRFVVEREMSDKRIEKEAELELLKERAAVLESQVEHLKNERGIEEELRSRFDVAKEGEQVVIIIDDASDADEKGQKDQPVTEDVKQGSLLKMLKFW